MKRFGKIASPIFAMSAFTIHVWAIFNMLWDYPSWLLRLNLWDLLGASAYTLFFALLESIVLAALLLFSAWFARKWISWEAAIAFSVGILFSSAVIAITLHVNENLWGQIRWLLLVWILSVLASFWLAVRNLQWRRFANGLAERLKVLSAVYVALDVLAMAIVMGRNL